MSKDLDNYLYFNDLIIKMSDSVDESDISDVLDNFYKELHRLAFVNYCNNDVLPDVTKLYIKILEKLPKDEAIESFKFMLNNYEVVINNKTLLLAVGKYPEISDYVFSKIYEELNKKYSEKNLSFLYLIAQGVGGIKKKLYLSQIFDYLNTGSSIIRISKLLKFHNENNFVLNIDNSVIDNLFEMINVALLSSSLNTEVADNIINLTVRLYNFPEYKKRSAKILKQIKTRTDIINPHQKKIIARVFNDVEDLRSNVEIAKRVEKSLENEYGYQSVEQIPIDEVSVLVLGGNGADDPKKANGYMKSIEYLLDTNGLRDNIGIYSVVYDFGESEDVNYSFNDGRARMRMAFEKGRRRLHALVSHRLERYVPGKKFDNDSSEQTNPRYIKKLFDIAILPRISQDGKKNRC